MTAGMEREPWHCADERYAALAQALIERGVGGVRGKYTRDEVPEGQEYKLELVELLGPSGTLADCRRVRPTNPNVGVSPLWLANEVAHFMDGSNPLSPILAWAPRQAVARFHALTEDGRVVNHYGFDEGALVRLAKALADNPASKRVVWPFFTKAHLFPSPEVPCALAQQFMLRDGALWSAVTYRSHDFFAGSKMDPIRHSVAQQALARMLGAEPGPMVMHEGSLHYYPRRKHRELADVAAWAEPRGPAEAAQHAAAATLEVFAESEPRNVTRELAEFVSAFRSGPAAFLRGDYEVTNRALYNLLAAAHMAWASAKAPRGGP